MAETEAEVGLARRLESDGEEEGELEGEEGEDEAPPPKAPPPETTPLQRKLSALERLKSLKLPTGISGGAKKHNFFVPPKEPVKEITDEDLKALGAGGTIPNKRRPDEPPPLPRRSGPPPPLPPSNGGPPGLRRPPPDWGRQPPGFGPPGPIGGGPPRMPPHPPHHQRPPPNRNFPSRPRSPPRSAPGPFPRPPFNGNGPFDPIGPFPMSQERVRNLAIDGQDLDRMHRRHLISLAKMLQQLETDVGEDMKRGEKIPELQVRVQAEQSEVHWKLAHRSSSRPGGDGPGASAWNALITQISGSVAGGPPQSSAGPQASASAPVYPPPHMRPPISSIAVSGPPPMPPGGALSLGGKIPSLLDMPDLAPPLRPMGVPPGVSGAGPTMPGHPVPGPIPSHLGPGPIPSVGGGGGPPPMGHMPFPPRGPLGPGHPGGYPPMSMGGGPPPGAGPMMPPRPAYPGPLPPPPGAPVLGGPLHPPGPGGPGLRPPHPLGHGAPPPRIHPPPIQPGPPPPGTRVIGKFKVSKPDYVITKGKRKLAQEEAEGENGKKAALEVDLTAEEQTPEKAAENSRPSFREHEDSPDLAFAAAEIEMQSELERRSESALSAPLGENSAEAWAKASHPSLATAASPKAERPPSSLDPAIGEDAERLSAMKARVDEILADSQLTPDQ